MKNNTKKIGLFFIILLVLIVVLLVIIKEKDPKINSNSQQQEEIMKIQENLQGSGLFSFDTQASKIIWEGKKTIIKEWVDTGSISIQSGEITLVDDKIVGGKIIIDMNSISAQKTGGGGGEDSLSKHLKSVDFFGVETFPTSEFILTSLSQTENGYIAKGDITIKNITKTIEFPMNVYMEDNSISIRAEIILDRTEFDVRYGSTNFFNDLGDNVINNDFTLKLELIAKKSE